MFGACLRSTSSSGRISTSFRLTALCVGSWRWAAPIKTPKGERSVSPEPRSTSPRASKPNSTGRCCQRNDPPGQEYARHCAGDRQPDIDGQRDDGGGAQQTIHPSCRHVAGAGHPRRQRVGERRTSKPHQDGDEPHAGDGNRFRLAGARHPRIALLRRCLFPWRCTSLRPTPPIYGALSCPDGRVDITWRIAPSAEDALELAWEETGGRLPVTEPTRKGFGSADDRKRGDGGTGGGRIGPLRPDGRHLADRRALDEYPLRSPSNLAD